MELYSHGWARLLFACGPQSFEIEGAGYCTDVLGDLVRAATEVVCCAYRTEVSFDGEPLEWRLIVQARAEESTATLSLLEFDTPAGHEVFACEVARDDFGRAVQSVATDMLDRHGMNGYRTTWGGAAFPTRALAALDAALSAPQA